MDKTGSMSPGISGSDLDVVETRRAGPMTGTDHLLRLALPAVRHTPQHPMVAIGDGRAGIPELSGDAAVSGVLQHARALAVANLPRDLAAELEVVALVIDRPAAVGLHINGAAHAAQYFFQRLFARKQTDVGHADERQTGPSGGAHGAVGTRLSDGCRGFARGHVTNELAVTNDVGALRGNSFVVEEKGSEAWAMLRPRIAHRVDDFRTVAQVVQLVERKKTHAGVISLRTQHAVQLYGMSDGFVNLQAKLAAVHNQIKPAFRALRRRMQGHRLFGDARGVVRQGQLVNQLIAFQLMLPAKRIRIGALLDFISAEAVSFESGTTRRAGLVDHAPN